jgi:dihydrofolate synthase/folylpolyglutamate synthase
LIEEAEVVTYLSDLFEVVERERIDVTMFEIVTMMAFLKFRDAKVDFGVFECGIGGRVCATNVLNPSATAITSVGWDHQDALGNTLDKIAY